jgi:hypothetical protein
MSPTTPAGYLVATLTQLAGILCLTIPVTILSANFEVEYTSFLYKRKSALALQFHVGWMVDRLLAPPTIADAFARWCIQIHLMRIADGEDAAEKEILVEQVTDLSTKIASLTETLTDALKRAQSLSSPPKLTLPPQIAAAVEAMNAKAASQLTRLPGGVASKAAAEAFEF